MKLLNSKNIILIIILFMSVFIFQLGNNAMLSSSNDNEKSDIYVIKTLNEDNPSIGEVVTYFKKNGFQNISFSSDFNHHAIIGFTPKSIHDLKVNLNINLSLCKNKNTAVVNKQYRELVYKKNGKEYINYRGDEYNVVGYYIDKKDDSLMGKNFYINTDSPSIRSDNYYDTVKIQDFGNYKRNQVKKVSKEIFNSFREGDEHESIDTRETYVFILFMCGLLVIFNCIGFVLKWLKYQKNEISIRLMIGATKSKIIKLLFARYFAIISLSLLLGTTLSLIVLKVARETDILSNVRLLFGSSLFPASILLSMLEIMFIGYILLGVNIILQFRRGNIFEKYKGC